MTSCLELWHKNRICDVEHCNRGGARESKLEMIARGDHHAVLVFEISNRPFLSLRTVRTVETRQTESAESDILTQSVPMSHIMSQNEAPGNLIKKSPKSERR